MLGNTELAKSVAVIQDLLKKDNAEIFQTEALGTDNSLEKDLSNDLDSLREIFPQLTMAISLLPPATETWAARIIQPSLTSLSGAFDSIERYNGAHKKPPQVRNQTSANFQRIVENTIVSWARVLSMAAFRQPKDNKEDALSALKKRVDEQEQKLGQQDNLRKELETEITEFRTKNKEASALISELKGVMGATKVADHAEAFGKLSSGHEESASEWLLRTKYAAYAVIAAVFLFILFSFVNPHLESYKPDFWGVTLAKGALFSVLITVALVCLRQYSAHTHNALVYKHRSTALDAFRAFAKASPDEDTKAAVLRQATAAIFAGRETGFSKGDSAGTQPVILEVLRNLTKTNPKQ